ncbi:MAG: plastocyanin/azurin family copper-binding protein [Patescibacteria group bacterium]
MKWIILVISLILVVVAGSYFVISKSGKKGNVVEKSSEPAPLVETSNLSTIKEFTVNGSNFVFQPKEIKVSKGYTVKIIFKDNDGMHNLVVDGYNVKTNIIKGGTQDSITFLADKVGQFEYYCSVENHKESGMVGTFFVE